MKLVIQIPCWNEESTLPETLADLPRRLDGFTSVEWQVVDDGSTDRTVEVARSCGVDRVVSLGEHRGLAAAFTAGIEAALEAGADVVVNTDADNQYRAECIADLVAPVAAGEADLVIGARPVDSIDDFSPLKRKLQRLGSAVVRLFSGSDVPDAASGFRALSRDAAERLQVFGRFSYTMETIIQAGWEGLRIRSVPIQVNASRRPSRLVRSMPRYIWQSGQTIVRSFALYKPFRFFFVLGLFPFAGALLLALRWVVLQQFTDWTGSRVPSLVAAAVLALVGVQLWIFAFVADLLSVNRRMIAAVRLEQRRAARNAARRPDPDA
jgi:glycosyltransferase involved in cell wall biosynthesis